MNAHTFEVWLAGRNPEHYCAGYVKGNANVCQDAKLKYTDGTSWALPKVTFDTHTSSNYISSPIICRVGLAKSTSKNWLGIAVRACPNSQYLHARPRRCRASRRTGAQT